MKPRRKAIVPKIDEPNSPENFDRQGDLNFVDGQRFSQPISES